MIRIPALWYYAAIMVSPIVLQPSHARADRLPEPPTRLKPYSCCVGRTGNIDCSAGDGVDVGDLTALIDNLFINFTPLCCNEEANCDGQGGVDVGDLTALIDNLFISFTPTSTCVGGLNVGDVIVSEIMPDPAFILDADGEWFELYNTSATDTFDLFDATIAGAGTGQFTIDTHLKIIPHGYVTFARSEACGFLPDFIFSGVTLPNTTGVVALKVGTTVIDQVTYTSNSGGFPTITPGKSLTLRATAMTAISNDTGSNWCLDGTNIYTGSEHGTPDAANTPCP